jgi:hypothetical protein
VYVNYIRPSVFVRKLPCPFFEEMVEEEYPGMEGGRRDLDGDPVDEE